MSKSQDKILLEWADLHDKNDALQAQRNQLKAALRKIELLPLHTVLMGSEPNGQCGHCIAKQALKEQA